MEFTTIYIVSQIFVIMSYVFLATTYFLKSRKNIIVSNFIALLMIGVAYIFLSAYTSVAMVVVALIRNIIFLYDEKKFGKNTKITKRDNYILIFLIFITIAFTIPTYNGFLSLLAVFATTLYTISVWQKNTKVYKILGIPITLLWIANNIYIMSVMGIVLETALFVSVVIGVILAFRKKKEIKK